ncbi:bax inhibitor 1-like [Nicotiana tomentosiformis]|uniref:bax inhibitor 1-like n=1 Tax=Nicotiana tomentosiformis TaxID=4098 RepID=UPI000879145E
MKFTEMKLHAMNAVKAYFKRNWKKEDMMNSQEIPLHAYKCLKKVYLTLFCALLSSTVGSFLHLIWEAGGFFTVLISAASILCLYFTPAMKVKKRVLFLMIAAYSLGASFGLFTEYHFGIDQGFVFSFLGGTTIGFGTFWFGAMLTRQRIDLYIGCLLHSYAFMYLWFVTASDIFGGHTTRWMIKACAVLALDLGYFVIYSQEILYNARYGDVNFVNCTFTVFFHLPAIVVHAARVYLVAESEHYRQN